MLGRPHSVPLVPDRHQRVRGQVVGRVRIAGQQVRQTGQFRVVPFEEPVEFGGSGIVDGCAHVTSPCAGSLARAVSVAAVGQLFEAREAGKEPGLPS
jgi:hypothetical protein